jgi:hypothetical protein
MKINLQEQFKSHLFGVVLLAFSHNAYTQTPAWLAGKPLNTWFEIPNTIHAGSVAAPSDDPKDIYCSSNVRLSFSGMGLRNAEIILAAGGGHGDYSGNEVTSIDLSADAPVWQLRSPATPVGLRSPNVAYYSDGKPTARHSYWSLQWSAINNRLMLHYTQFSYGSAVSFPNTNGFNLDNNTWDPENTWPNGVPALCQDNKGNCWASTGYFTLNKWTPATDTWTATGTFNDAVYPTLAYDALRDQLFQLSWGDGVCCGIGVNAFKYNASGTTQTAITFNPSAAYTQFQADKPFMAGMSYDPDNDRFLFFDGRTNATNDSNVYVITPNSGTVWDMGILSVSGLTPPVARGAGVNNRFCYVASLKGFVYMASGTENVYFLRTSNVTAVPDAESSTDQLSIYPNPSSGIFNIRLDSKYVGEVTVSVINALGQNIKQVNLNKSIPAMQTSINLSEEAKGIYFLQIQTSDKIIVNKLLK